MNNPNSPEKTKTDTAKYKKVPIVIRYFESLEDNEIQKLGFSLPKEGFRKNDIIDYLFKEIQRIKEDSEKQAQDSNYKF